MLEAGLEYGIAMTRGPRILLGHITGAHGIRGEVVVRTYTARPEDIGAYGPLEDESGTRAFVLASVRAGPKGVVVRIEGVRDRNAAEALKGAALHVPRSRLPDLPEGEFYQEDLVGLKAVDPGGRPVGTVVAVLNYGAGDILELEVPGARQTELIPFKSAYVPAVDIAGGRLTIVRPEETSGEPPPDDGTAGA